MEEFDGGMLPKKTWTAEEDDGVEEEEEWVGPKQAGDEDDEDMRCDTWPPPVVNKMDPILVNFGPPTEEVRKAHEDKLARVLSDGSNLDEEEQDFIFIQLPRRMPVLDEPAPAAPPVAAPVAPPVVVKTEGAPPGTTPVEAGKPEPEVPVRQQSENALNKMRSGYLGQMYVHASGKVTFHMGDATIYEVQPGLPCYFAQDVVSMAPDEKAFCVLGNVRKKLVCVPNLDEALPSQS